MPENLKPLIRNVPDFPKPGINFKDITPMLADHKGFEHCLNLFVEQFKGEKIDKIAAIESRGFIFGAPLAQRLECGLLLIRKPGKLPADTYRETYQLEYGEDSLEVHKDSIEAGERVLVIDDLLATGGTAAATGRLLDKIGAETVGFAFVIELSFLKGRERLLPHKTTSLIQYDAE